MASLALTLERRPLSGLDFSSFRRRRLDLLLSLAASSCFRKEPSTRLRFNRELDPPPPTGLRLDLALDPSFWFRFNLQLEPSLELECSIGFLFNLELEASTAIRELEFILELEASMARRELEFSLELEGSIPSRVLEASILGLARSQIRKDDSMLLLLSVRVDLDLERCRLDPSIPRLVRVDLDDGSYCRADPSIVRVLLRVDGSRFGRLVPSAR